MNADLGLMDIIRKLILSMAPMLWLALCPGMGMATAQELPSEQSVRSVMVFNFLKFTDFYAESPTKAANIHLCIAVRDNRQSEALFALSGRKVGGRTLQVMEVSRASEGCEVLYVDSRQQWNALEDLPSFRHALTISSQPGFAQDGGIIEILVQEDGVQFDINLAEGRRAGLHFAPQLLRLARRVHE